jgi:DNA mismatch repair protein MSH5
MGFKRRRLSSKASSSQQPTSSSQPSSRPKPFARLASVTRSIPLSTPSLPAHPRQSRLSLGPPSSLSPASRFRNEDALPLETDAEIQAREDSDEMNEVIMAVDMRDKSTVGCSYYNPREEKLYIMQDIKMAGLDIVDLLKIHAQPTLMLISTLSEDKLEEHLSKEARGIDRGDEESTLYTLKTTNLF